MTGAHSDRNEKRDFIIEKCYECYVENGIEHTSTRSFCNAASLNINTLYYYFDSKEEILFECVNYGYKKLEHALFEAMDNGSVSEIFSKLLNVWTGFSPEMRFLCQAVSSPAYEEQRQQQFSKVNYMYDRFGKELAQRFGCPHKVISPYIHEILTLMSYYSLWGSDEMASIQCNTIFQEMLDAVETYLKQDTP